ncbi:hypothetical protein [Streptomyces hygroscopicus]|uniref:hypothetical protein n=1 Tax=Streptomyces hygroscopicus TaxID=1912 RepID=UPI00223F72D1|nr:hypothetical protein [Streptomyces hygroscopicus]
MRAVALGSAAGALLLTGLVTVPAVGAAARPGDPQLRGTAVAARHAASAGTRFRKPHGPVGGANGPGVAGDPGAAKDRQAP